MAGRRPGRYTHANYIIRSDRCCPRGKGITVENIKNSALLEKIFGYAKKLGGNGGQDTPSLPSMTAERYIAAVIDILVGAPEAGTDGGKSGEDKETAEKKALFDILSDHFPPSAPGFESVRSYMLERVNEIRDDAFADGIYMQRRVYKAQAAAREKQSDCLTAPELLSVIAPPSLASPLSTYVS